MTINHNPTLKAGDVADMYHTGTDRFYEATVVKLLADHEARERFRAGRRVPPGRAVPAYEMTRSEVLEWVRMHGGDTGHFVSDAACDDFTAQLEERLPSNVDTQRCIDARNALNDVIHGEGAVIDDLEGIVALAVAQIKNLRATNESLSHTAAQLAVVDQGRQKTPSYREKQELRERIKELEIEIERLRATNESLRRTIADPPGDVQEAVLKKLGLYPPRAVSPGTTGDVIAELESQRDNWMGGPDQWADDNPAQANELDALRRAREENARSVLRALFNLIPIDGSDFYYNEPNDYGVVTMHWFCGEGDPSQLYRGVERQAQYFDGTRETDTYYLNDAAIDQMLKQIDEAKKHE